MSEDRKAGIFFPPLSAGTTSGKHLSYGRTYYTLHSNMFLLIHRPARWSCTANDFTFHYVSINTEKTCTLGWAQNYFTFHYVSINTKTKKLYHASHTPLHSNMFLLIPVPRFPEAHPHRTLHSNMFLLILDGTFIDHLGFFLYIPICFY